MTNEISRSFQSIHLDRINEVPSPIEDINNNLKPFGNFLRIAHINSVSIPLHRDEISRVINSTNLDIVGISETNIKKATLRDRFKFQNYKLFHIDRDWGRNGGVGILVKQEYASSAKLIKVNYNQIMPEYIFIEIEINKIKLLVGVIYKSPKVRYGVYRDFFEVMAYLTTKYSHCIFLGDMNICQLETASPAFKFFQKDILEPLSLKQIVNSPTRITKETCTLLDLILVNAPENVKFVGTTDLPGFSDHKLIYCSYALKKIKFKAQLINRRDMRSFLTDKFISDVANVH